MATAKPLKPNTYNGETCDAQTIDTWLARMTTYLRLTHTAEEDEVDIASSYFEDIAYTWYANHHASFTTFDLFKSSLQNHFVPQNHKETAYRQYKTFSQGTLSVLDYSIRFKALAVQAGDLVSATAQHTDFVEGLHRLIKPFIVAQPAIPNETWENLVGRALRQEETLPANYNLKAAPQPENFQRTTSGPRNPNLNRADNWRSKPLNLSFPGNKPSFSRKSFDPLSDSDREFLSKHEGCFRCRKTYAGHFWKDCPAGVSNPGGSGHARGSNVKKEEVSIVDGYVVPSVQFDVDSDSYPSVPIITIPTRIHQAIVDSAVDPGASINVISPMW